MCKSSFWPIVPANILRRYLAKRVNATGHSRSMIPVSNYVEFSVETELRHVKKIPGSLLIQGFFNNERQ